MSAKWTSKQNEAIYTTNCNILVDAAAGSGKTAVLVERIINKITCEKPVDIDTLLVVTFTKAAASEMKERIALAIADRLKENPNDGNLQRQSVLLSRAEITTIDAFCLNVVKNNFHLLDINPAFSIGDNTEIELLRLDTIDELFDSLYEAQDLDFLSLATSYSDDYADKKLKQAVISIHRYISSLPFPIRWLLEKSKMTDTLDLENNEWIITIKNSASMLLVAQRMLLENTILDISEEKYITTLENDLTIINELISLLDGDWDVFRTALNVGFTKLPVVKNAEPFTKELVQTARGEVKASIKRLVEDFFAISKDDIIKSFMQTKPFISSLCKLVKLFDENFKVKKQKKSLLDFSDVEHLCLEILLKDINLDVLEPSEVANSLKSKYNEILIDEYQDSNQLQETIFSLVSNGGNIFVVGDLKQSIYKFRHTDPMLFKSKKQSYLEDIETTNRKITLPDNFRSRKAVIDGVNMVFSAIMSDSLGDVEYDETQRLHLGASYPNTDENSAGACELHILETDYDEAAQIDETDSEIQDEDIDEIITSNIEKEAMLVSKRIKELIASNYQVFDKGTGKYRTVEFRDIMVLMRSARQRADVFAEILNASGIDSFADTGGYFMQTEVISMISLLKLIDNPFQDIPLLATLKSIMNFTDDDLANIRLADKRSDLYSALLKKSRLNIKFSLTKKGYHFLSKTNEITLSARCRSFIRQLENWREMTTYMPCDKLIWQIYDDTGYYSLVGAMVGGMARQANLRLLFERARAYEGEASHGLFRFITFLEHINARSGDMSTAKLLSENHNVVQVMTIHKSKGLEKPVVFLCLTGKAFYMPDLRESIIIDSKLGIGADFIDTNESYTYPMLSKIAIKEKKRIEMLSEEMRVLYVALTRAREKLIVTATISNIEKRQVLWKKAQTVNSLSAYQLIRMGSYLDWIGSALELNGINEEIVDKEKAWNVYAWHNSDLNSSQVLQDSVNVEHEEILDRSVINDILGYQYPISIGYKSKVSVSELKRIYEMPQEEDEALPTLLAKPQFIDTKAMTYAEIGTINHFVMQHLTLCSVMTKQEISTQINKMVDDGIITLEQKNVLLVDSIASFFKTDIGKHLLTADKVYREVAFEIAISANEIYNVENQEEIVLVQGIIDCYFVENNNVFLIDYKTDHITDINIIKSRYKKQLDYYALALQKMTQKEVKFKYIYLFSANSVIEC